MEKISLREIESILFGIYSPEEIIRQSVCKVHVNKLNGEGTVYDERMGTLEQNKLCNSCGLDCKDCPGHIGRIELNHLIMHPMYHRSVVNFLKCICHKCYRFLLTEDHISSLSRYTKESKFTKILEKLEKVSRCAHEDCQKIKPKITYNVSEGTIKISYNVKGGEGKNSERILDEEEIKKIFDNVSDDDVRLLGFDPELLHPKNLILSVLPVLPPISRPYIVAETVTCDDDLTTQYFEIVKTNNHLKEDLPSDKKNKYIQNLKFRIKTLMNNSQNKARRN